MSHGFRRSGGTRAKGLPVGFVGLSSSGLDPTIVMV